VYGFDLNENWREDRENYDNQKMNGLTLPRMIRTSAFTAKLDIEGCAPLGLPVAALLYQQANNFWLRKLAHGRELYLIPTGDIASVVFATELLSQLRNRGIDLARISQIRARQDGKHLDKTANTKYAAQIIVDPIQGWLPLKATDPDSQHETTQLRNQVAELRQRLGATPTRPASSSSQASPIQRAPLNAATPTNPLAFDSACLVSVPLQANKWLVDHLPPGLADRTFNSWPTSLTMPDAQKAVLQTNIKKAEDLWANQPPSAVDTVQKVAIMMGIPLARDTKNFNDVNLIKILTIAITRTC